MNNQLKTPAAAAPSLFAVDAKTFLDMAAGPAADWMTAWQAVQSECACFAAKRLHRNLDLAQRLGQTIQPQHVLELQREWARTAWEDYAEQAGRTVGIAFDLATGSLKPLAPVVACAEAKPAEPTKEAPTQPVRSAMPAAA